MKPTRTTLAATLQITCAALAAAPALAATEPPGHFEASVAHPATWQASAYRGETVAISAQLTGADGRPFPVPEGAGASMLWSTNGVDWFAPRPATVTTGGLIRATWTPDMDCGADSYRIFLRVDDGGTSNVNYRANMLLRMLGSPGAVPNELPLPAKSIDFSAVAALNAPWIEEETDPIWEAEKGGYATTGDVARAISAIDIPDPDLSFTNDFVKTESDPVWASEKGDYASTSQVAQATLLLARFSHWVMQEDEWVTDAHPFDCAFDDAASPPQWAIAYAWSPDYGINYFDDAAYTGNTNREAVSVAATAYKPQLGEFTLSATRSRLPGYILGSQDENPVAGVDDLSGYATSADLAAVEASASLVGLLLQGSNVVAEVAYYNSRVRAPELRLLQLGESNEYHQVWSETNGLARTLAGAIEHADGATNALDAAKADRAWSHHTSGLGADAPDGYTWMSTPNTVLAGGLEFEKHVTTGGAIWILKSNGMSADFHAQTNNAAFLDLSSADGTPVFRVEKTDSYLVGVDVTSLSVSGDTLVCGVNAIAAEHPLVRVRPSLSTGEWIKEEDGIPASMATVQWSGSSGAWVCEITNNTGGNSFFATMEYLQEGGTKIINSAPLDVSQGILCTDGVHRVRPVYNNGGVTWQVMQ